MNNLSQMFITPDGKDRTRLFILICSLFLLWGFSMGLIDVLNKHFQAVLHISKGQSGFIQFAYYMGYFIMAIPAGLLAKRFGYKCGIIIGLILVALGALWTIPATRIGTLFAFLISLFIVASGFSFLETVANPYSIVLGPQKTAASRINFAQSFNALGQLLGPFFGGQIILSASIGDVTDSSKLYIPYVGIAVIVIILVLMFVFAHIPDIQIAKKFEENQKQQNAKPFWRKWHFNLAVVAQLLYMIAQTGIYSFFINYTVSNLPHISDRTASVYLAFGGFGMFLLGRLIGSFILRKARAHRMLAFYAIVNVILIFIVVFSVGMLGILALIGSFFFMSIMYPTIFTLGIHGLGEQTKQASSLIVMTIVGGAFTPVMGHVADIININAGFIIPLACFFFIFIYSVLWKKLLNC
jgi:FHS family L-fucose permease-like MFS transporter